jgi:hypothetical protein
MRRFIANHGLQIACALIVLMAGCEMRREDMTLRHRIDTLSIKLDSLTDALELQRENDSMLIDDRSVILVPGESRAFVRTDVGFLTVLVDNFEAFGNGTRVTFRFGNPGSVTLKGMRAYLEWSVGDANGDSGMRTPVLYEFLTDLKPGALTAIKVTVEDTPPERLRSVRVSKVRFEEVDFSVKDREN